MDKEKFFSEATLNEVPTKRIIGKIKDGSVVTSKLADKSVTAEKLAMGVGTPYGMATLDATGNVPLSQLGNAIIGTIDDISIGIISTNAIDTMWKQE